MKTYIPFNSNDFNSVFTTLSISPAVFYNNRGFSYKRSSVCLLSPNPKFLLGFDLPVFHLKKNDWDEGVPLLLEVDLDLGEFDCRLDNHGFRYKAINRTIFLVASFKVLFRAQQELDEVFARSLKSIEAKYVDYAKTNSQVAKDFISIENIPDFFYPKENNNLTEAYFYNERFVDRMFGAVLGGLIGCLNSLPASWMDISKLLRELNNKLAIYVNRLNGANEVDKDSLFILTSEFYAKWQKVETLETTILLSSNMSTEDIDRVKSLSVLGVSVFELLIQGLVVGQLKELPVSLLIKRLELAIKAKYNSRFPVSYIEKLDRALSDLNSSIEGEIDKFKDSNLFCSNIIRFTKSDSRGVGIILNTDFGFVEGEYLKETVLFFLRFDGIVNVDAFFSDRRGVLIELANHFKKNIADFDDSEERKYLLRLMKSFESLRDGFNITSIDNEVLRVLGILFTSGRDLSHFIDNLESELISNLGAALCIWGTVYGAASLPKTLMKGLGDNIANTRILIDGFAAIIKDFTLETSDSSDSTHTFVRFVGPSLTEDSFTEKDDSNNNNESPVAGDVGKFSEAELMILDIVALNKRLSLSELKKRCGKVVKSQSDLEDVILNELNLYIKIEKEGGKKVAVYKSGTTDS
ncbi:hypothetical protein HNQ91_003287 [Filimonas zeae]|uniref:Uncharacterized protein n=1 Tax=Filimonas zeae TaxID=1737353 RepID=A0A917IZM9_9BACT|nr:hypothetical protein [Filimonas zeae]MDR6340222.1 hypothetical protein [Filimonas zeae]GGH71723.1 hypothetical protein GCM10011379_31370 [Filimonas zeae]